VEISKIARGMLSLLLLMVAVSFCTFVALSYGQAGERPFSWDTVFRLYGSYAVGIVRGDLGHTYRGELVQLLILRSYFKSFGVLGLALGLACFAGTGIGLLSQWHRGTAASRWPIAFSILLSAPSFLVGGLMQYVDVELAVRLRAVPLPTTGFG